MPTFIKTWCRRQTHAIGYIDTSDISGFAWWMALRCVIVANLAVLLLHLLLDAFALLPYPLSQALIVGLSATTVVTVAVSFTVSYLHGLAMQEVLVRSEEFERLSSTDTLSGLKNRRAFFDYMERCRSDAAFVLFDIDRFKLINDTYGHLVGDDVIREVAKIFSELFASPDACVARIGGEEFAVLLETEPGLTHRTLIERARIAVAAWQFESAPGVQVTVSAGVAARPPGRGTKETYSAADKALYVAKASGRNRVVHEPEFTELGEDRGQTPAERAMAG